MFPFHNSALQTWICPRRDHEQQKQENENNKNGQKLENNLGQ